MKSKHKVKVGTVVFGGDPLCLIAGPCVIEKELTMLKVAEKLKKLSEKHHIPLVYKSSFQKDNRSSLSYYTGPGIKKGLKILAKIKKEFSVPVLSDVHYPSQVKLAAEVLDVIQIPAYLCMQTDLAVAVAKTNRPVNLKHGQFLAPENMINPINKITKSGNKKIILTERGCTFGYNDLVVDPRSFYHMLNTGYPVVFDVTHSVRKYGIPSSDPKGGSREFMEILARSAVAAGVHGLFIETHPNPAKALCDASSQMPLSAFEEFIKPLLELHESTNRIYSS